MTDDGRSDRRHTNISLTLKHGAMLVGALLTLSTFGTGVVLWLGGKLVSPGDTMAAIVKAAHTETIERRHADSLLAAQFNSMASLQATWRDTVTKSLRRSDIKLCLTTKPYDQALLDIDCDSILHQARLRSLGLPNTLERIP